MVNKRLIEYIEKWKANKFQEKSQKDQKLRNCHKMSKYTWSLTKTEFPIVVEQLLPKRTTSNIAETRYDYTFITKDCYKIIS